MVTVTAITGREIVKINDPASNSTDARITGTYSHAVRAIDTCVFNIYKNNPGFDSILLRRTRIRITDESGKIKFMGRVIRINPNLGQDGQIYKTVTCEGWMGYLHDYSCGSLPVDEKMQSELQRQLALRNEYDLSYANCAIEYVHKTAFNNIPTPDMGAESYDLFEYIYRACADNSLEWKAEELYLPDDPTEDARVRFSLTRQMGNANKTGMIVLGENLISYSKEDDASNIVTALIALGAKLYTDEDNTERVRVTDDFGFTKLLTPTDSSTINAYGRVIKTVIFEDCKDAETLETTAQAYLDSICNTAKNVSISAIDPKYIGDDDETIGAGDVVLVYIPQMGVNEYVRVTEVNECIEDVSRNTFKFSSIDVVQSYSGSVGTPVSTNDRLITIESVMQGNAAFVKAQVHELDAKVANIDEITTNKITAVEGDFNTLTSRVGEFETATAKNFTATNGQITNLSGDVADFKKVTTDNFTATNGNVANLSGDVADFEDATAKNFTATNGQITTLSGDVATFKETTTEHLNAADGRIKILETNALTTDTLVAHLATIDVANMHSIFTDSLTALSTSAAQSAIDQAYILDAVVNNMTVADLKTKVASAETIALISNDGKTAIGFKNATQQFYDADGNVRVQIGQDATGAFNFLVRGSDGTTALFDENGIKKDAIPDSIIVTDMLADGSVSKEKINFPIIEPNEQGGVDITQVYDGDEKFGVEYTSFKSEITQSVNDAQSAADDAQADIDGLAIGGRNLVSGTNTEIVEHSGYPASGYSGGLNLNSNAILDGDEYVISFEAKSTVAGDVITCYFYSPNNTTVVETSTGYHGSDRDGYARVTLSDSWQRYWIKYKQNPNSSDNTKAKNILIGRQFSGDGTGNVSVRRNVKLEKGNKATDWTPAPEDIESQFTTLTDTISGVSSVADSVSKSITNKVWQTDITTAVNNYDGSTVKTIRDRVSKTETDIEGITSTVSDISANTYTKTEVDQKADSWMVTAKDYTDTAVDGVEVGGRNMARLTNQGRTYWGWSMATGDASSSEYVENGVRTCVLTRGSVAAGGWSVISYYSIGREKWEPNTEYTLSVDVKANVVTWFSLDFRAGDFTGALTKSVTTIQNKTVAGEWVKLIWTVRSTDTLTSATNQVAYFSGMNSIAGTTYQFKNLKLEKGNKATDWSPAPEDIDANIASVKVNADKISLLVKSGDSESNMVLTDRLYSLVANNIDLTGKVTFSSLATDAQTKINNAQNTADNIANNIYTSGTTTINGAKITTGSIKAAQIDVEDLFSQTIETKDFKVSGSAGSETFSFYASEGVIELSSLKKSTDGSNMSSILTMSHGTTTLTGDLEVDGSIIGVLSGNASTATKLAVARTLTIGSKGKTFNGSGNVSWSLSEIGALPLTGGTLTGELTATRFNGSLHGGLLNLAYGTGSYSTYVNLAMSAFIPSSSSSITCGSSSYKWSTVYAASSTIVTSDRNEKHNISYIGSDTEYNDTNFSDDKVVELIRGIKSAVYKFNDGTSDRPHHGLIAQDFEELMERIGISDHAGFIKSPREVLEYDEDGVPSYRTVEGEYDYAFRYEELITDLIRFAQLLDKRLDAIEQRIQSDI